MKIKELLNSPDKWVKRFYAKDKNGDFVWGDDFEAVCWCLVGACQKIYPTDANIRGILNKKVREMGFDCATSFNDHENTTFEDVKKLLEELDI